MDWQAEGSQRATNPLRNSNKLKLALFGTNGTGGALTLHPDRFEPTWDTNVRIAQLADELGIEALISFSRWRPYCGTDGGHSGQTLDTVAWAAGLAAVTKRICLMTTIHTFLYHPLMVAKLGATIDRISNGRWGLNIVCGWFKTEFEMFGKTLAVHDDRYNAADEWMEIIDRVWAEQKSFDYDGQFFKTKGAYSDPKPIQPRPIIMNAGGSDRALEFTAQHCDMAFVLPYDPRPEALRKQAESYRRTAREKYGRDVQVWMNTYCVHRDTIAEAHDYVREYAVEHGDFAAANGFIASNIVNAKTTPVAAMEKMSLALRSGAGGYPLLGSTEDIFQSLNTLSDAGVDGVLLTWIDYEDGLRRFGNEIIPLLEQAGLRQPLPAHW